MCSTERKYPTDKPWAFISPSAARTAGSSQGLPCKSDTYFSNDANPLVPKCQRRAFTYQRRRERLRLGFWI